ncbi:tyrosine-type recombinase/integrase [Alistipes indistinctus]|jgi:tyrosine type site-specific recombinase|uniref:tyrosine-type recombinase/integrase n=1 Tax=Alistipes indistinctus TaxID=626932 RepID=UPI0026DC88D1|nr:tyrosine-type recombinase/integrase [Alistipes indistinctus]
MSRIKGLLTTADYLPYEEYLRLLHCLHHDRFYKWEVYCKVSFCTAFRVSDVRSTHWKDILGKNEFIKIEQKTQKARLVKINDEIRNDIQQMYQLLGKPDTELSVICNLRTGEPYSQQHINVMLKWFLWKYKLNIKRFSTHSFRKTFGRYVYESLGRTSDALVRLSQILNHKNIETTRRYIGLDQDDIDEVFESLSFDTAAIQFTETANP